MKLLLAMSIFVSSTAFGNSLVNLSSKVRKPAQATAQKTVAEVNTPAQTQSLLENKVFVTTNIVDLTQGNGNLDAHFLATDSVAFSFNYITSSKQERVPDISTTNDIKVDRRAYGIGGAWFVKPFSNKTTYMINPTFQFGQRSDLLTVDNKNGLRLKLSAIHKPTSNFALEAGLKADNLEENFKGEFLVGVGIIL